MTVVLPALSEDGWVDNSIKQADYAISHFFLNDYSQTYIYNREISSLPWILEETQNDYPTMRSLITNTLIKYFSRYFTNVIVDCIVEVDPSNPNKGQIKLYIAFTDRDGIQNSIGKIILYNESKIKEVTNLSNFGT